VAIGSDAAVVVGAAVVVDAAVVVEAVRAGAVEAVVRAGVDGEAVSDVADLVAFDEHATSSTATEHCNSTRWRVGLRITAAP